MDDPSKEGCGLRVSLILAVVSLLVLSGLTYAKAETGNSATCYMLKTPITLDGKWTSADEWSDAVSLPMRFNPNFKVWGLTENGTAYCMVKHDKENLYVLIDAVSSTSARGTRSGGWDFYGVNIDATNDKSKLPTRDDLYVFITWMDGSPAFYRYMGFGTNATPWNWNSPIRDPVYMKQSLTSSPFSDKPHIVCEAAIPLRGLSSTIGFTSAAENKPKSSAVTWPSEALENVPQTWGTLIISSEEKPAETLKPTETPTPSPTQTPSPTPTPTESPTPTSTTIQTQTSTPPPVSTQQTGVGIDPLIIVAVATVVVLVVAGVFIRKRRKAPTKASE